MRTAIGLMLAAASFSASACCTGSGALSTIACLFPQAHLNHT